VVPDQLDEGFWSALDQTELKGTFSEIQILQRWKYFISKNCGRRYLAILFLDSCLYRILHSSATFKSAAFFIDGCVGDPRGGAIDVGRRH
jgi:hypothetical protein